MEPARHHQTPEAAHVPNRRNFTDHDLGRVKLGGLDKLRVTLKVELFGNQQAPIQAELDLYHSSQVAKLTETPLSRLFEGSNERKYKKPSKVLTSELEKWRMSQL